MLPLRTRIVIATCTVAVVFTLAADYVYFTRAERAAIGTAISRMSGETRLLAAHFKNRHDQLSNDLFLVSASPTVQRLVDAPTQASFSEYPDLVGQSLMQTATDLFISLLASRPEYDQVSLYSIANQGSELLRVERMPEGLRRVPDSRLQRSNVDKLMPAVFGHSWTRQPHSRSEAQVLFSEVDGHNGFGVTSSSGPLTVKAALPLFRPDNQLFGFIVIVADYDKLLTAAFAGIGHSSRVLVAKQSGTTLAVGADGRITQLWPGPEGSPPLPASEQAILATKASEGSLFTQNRVSYFVQSALSQEAPDDRVTIVLQVPREEIVGQLSGLVTGSIVLTLASVLLVGLATERLTNRLMGPLKRLEREVTKARTNQADLKLPVESADEIGTLARAFQDLIDDHVQAENRLGLLIDNIGEGVITINDTGRIESFNPACEHIFQHHAEDVIGRSVEILMPEEMAGVHSSFLDRFREERRRKVPWKGRVVTGLRRNGTTFPMELTISELLLDERLVFIGILRDITERQAAEQAKSQFVATISHELRTPLTSIHGALGLLQTDTVLRDPAKTRRMVEIALSNSKRLLQLINDILDFEKLSAATITLDPAAHSLRALVRETIDLFSAAAAAAGVTVEFIDAPLDARVLVDRERLIQAMGNLLSNAVKFSDRGDTVRVRIETDRDRKKVRVRFEDDGSGIPEQAMATIFDRFTQADSSDSRSKGGTGLGLHVARTIIELHGGSMGLNSTVNVGTTVYFELDAIYDPTDPEATG